MSNLTLSSISNFIIFVSSIFVASALLLVRSRKQADDPNSTAKFQAGSGDGLFSNYDTASSWNEKIQSILSFGTKRLGLTQAMLVEFETNDEARIIELYSANYRSNEYLQKNLIIKSSNLYCGKLWNGTDILAIDYAGLSNWRNHAAYRQMGVESYIGVPVRRNGKFFGVLSFFDALPRENFFTSSEKDFVRELGNWAGVILDRENLDGMHEDISVELNSVASSAEIVQ